MWSSSRKMGNLPPLHLIWIWQTWRNMSHSLSIIFVSWSIQHSLPFQTIPKVILTHMVFYAVKLLNYFPVKGGVSKIYGPKAVMPSRVLDFKFFSRSMSPAWLEKLSLHAIRPLILPRYSLQIYEWDHDHSHDPAPQKCMDHTCWRTSKGGSNS